MGLTAGGIAIAIAAVVALLGANGPAKGAWRVVTIAEGATESDVARLLADEGAVPSALVVRVAFAIAGGGEVVPGEHLVPGDASPRQLVPLLTRDPDRPKARVVLPEGLHRIAIAERLESAGIATKSAFLAATIDPRVLEAAGVPRSRAGLPESAEGFLFPATYELSVDSSAPEVVARLVREWRARYERLAKKHAQGAARLADTLGWGPREIVTLASIVEKETGAADERPLIAGVFENRLTREDFTPRLLQSDPTSAYACVVEPTKAPGCAGFEGKPTPETNRDPENRYSTYTHEGLPPGPIANPGEAAIAAVLAPAETRALYFVAKGGGRHAFSESYEEHQRAIDAWRRSR
jgi:UPF0755 protein